MTGRRRAGLSQEQLAERLGRPQSTIARWETGQQHPPLESIIETLHACGLELTVGIARYDDSYQAQIARQLRLDPAERVRRMTPAWATEGFDPIGTLAELARQARFIVIGDVAGEKAKRALVEVYNRRSPIGLVGSSINVKTGEWTDPTSHISGGIDSYYEYLLKAWLLFDDKDCERMWKASIDAVNKYLADQAPTGFWYGQANMNTGARTGTDFGALDAFFPGTLALSGDLDRARKLEDSAYKMWTTFGIEPEEINYTTMKITSGGYELRPEIIESAFYLRHFTNDPRYREMGRTFFDSLVKYCRTDVGYAALSNVASKTKKDEMESFFFAETLKYLYLLYAPPETLDLSKVVFNTEAHPIRRTW